MIINPYNFFFLSFLISNMMIDDSDVVYDLRLMDFSKTFPLFPFSLSASNLCITVNSNFVFLCPDPYGKITLLDYAFLCLPTHDCYVCILRFFTVF